MCVRMCMCMYVALFILMFHQIGSSILVSAHLAWVQHTFSPRFIFFSLFYSMSWPMRGISPFIPTITFPFPFTLSFRFSFPLGWSSAWFTFSISLSLTLSVAIVIIPTQVTSANYLTLVLLLDFVISNDFILPWTLIFYVMPKYKETPSIYCCFCLSHLAFFNGFCSTRDISLVYKSA